MAWTESGSRDEWLARVRRRGERLRRRRQLTIALVSALAMVLPVGAVAGLLSASPDREEQLSVAGPAPAGPAMAGELGPSSGVTLPSEPAAETGPPTTLSGLSVENVHPRREAPVPPADAAEVPGPAASIPSGDGPFARPTTTVASAGTASGSPLTPNESPRSATSAGATTATATPCPPEMLQIDVVPSKATFARGEAVTGTFFLQTGAADGCLLSLPSAFRIEEVATGKALRTVGATTDFVSPARAEPGRMYTSTFSWDQTGCSGSACAPVTSGLYQAVAVWRDGGSYRGWGEFRIGG